MPIITIGPMDPEVIFKILTPDCDYFKVSRDISGYLYIEMMKNNQWVEFGRGEDLVSAWNNLFEKMMVTWVKARLAIALAKEQQEL
jgi:hypothetical protein